MNRSARNVTISQSDPEQLMLEGIAIRKVSSVSHFCIGLSQVILSLVMAGRTSTNIDLYFGCLLGVLNLCFSVLLLLLVVYQSHDKSNKMMYRFVIHGVSLISNLIVIAVTLWNERNINPRHMRANLTFMGVGAKNIALSLFFYLTISLCTSSVLSIATYFIIDVSDTNISNFYQADTEASCKSRSFKFMNWRFRSRRDIHAEERPVFIANSNTVSRDTFQTDAKTSTVISMVHPEDVYSLPTKVTYDSSYEDPFEPRVDEYVRQPEVVVAHVHPDQILEEDENEPQMDGGMSSYGRSESIDSLYAGHVTVPHNEGNAVVRDTTVKYELMDKDTIEGTPRTPNVSPIKKTPRVVPSSHGPGGVVSFEDSNASMLNSHQGATHTKTSTPIAASITEGIRNFNKASLKHVVRQSLEPQHQNTRRPSTSSPIPSPRKRR